MKKAIATAKAVVDGNLAKIHAIDEDKPDRIMCETIIANATKSAGGVMFASIPVKCLALDHAYQRRTLGHEKAIAKAWDESKCEVLIVSYRNGRFYIVDGQHRYKAAQIRGIERLYCLIHTNWTQADEARAFAAQDRLKKRVSWANKITAGAVGGEETSIAVRDICRKYNVVSDPVVSKQLGSLTAPYKAVRIVECYGADLLDIIFEVIQRLGWHMEGGAYCGDVLYALRDILVKPNTRQQNAQKLISAWSGTTLEDVFIQARAKYPSLNRRVAIAKHLTQFMR